MLKFNPLKTFQHNDFHGENSIRKAVTSNVSVPVVILEEEESIMRPWKMQRRDKVTKLCVEQVLDTLWEHFSDVTVCGW